MIDHDEVDELILLLHMQIDRLSGCSTSAELNLLQQSCSALLGRDVSNHTLQKESSFKLMSFAWEHHTCRLVRYSPVSSQNYLYTKIFAFVFIYEGIDIFLLPAAGQDLRIAASFLLKPPAGITKFDTKHILVYAEPRVAALLHMRREKPTPQHRLFQCPSCRLQLRKLSSSTGLACGAPEYWLASRERHALVTTYSASRTGDASSLPLQRSIFLQYGHLVRRHCLSVSRDDGSDRDLLVKVPKCVSPAPQARGLKPKDFRPLAPGSSARVTLLLLASSCLLYSAAFQTTA